MSAPRCHPTLRESEYVVTLDGVELGIVRKRSEHYNLRRAVTLTYWLVQARSGVPVRHPATRSGGYRTRAAAVAALVEAAAAA